MVNFKLVLSVISSSLEISAKGLVCGLNVIQFLSGGVEFGCGVLEFFPN